MAHVNPKSALQELLQKQGLPLPAYHEDGQRGPDHCRVFRSRVTVKWHGEELVERGEGGGKKVGARSDRR